MTRSRRSTRRYSARSRPRRASSASATSSHRRAQRAPSPDTAPSAWPPVHRRRRSRHSCSATAAVRPAGAVALLQVAGVPPLASLLARLLRVRSATAAVGAGGLAVPRLQLQWMGGRAALLPERATLLLLLVARAALAAGAAKTPATAGPPLGLGWAEGRLPTTPSSTCPPSTTRPSRRSRSRAADTPRSELEGGATATGWATLGQRSLEGCRLGARLAGT